MSHADKPSPYRLAVVAPCYNEEAGLPEFVRRVKAVCLQLGCIHEIVLVNDGSRDRTFLVACELAAADPTIKVINLLRNFGSLMDWVVRDESLHLKFGINLILTVLEENPELQTEEFAAEIKKMITDAVEMEEQYNHDLLPGGILGLNANYINQYVKYLADRRLEELGFDPEYNVTNPAKWMATANDTLQLVNFFESTNTSYESNASATSKSPAKAE